MKRASVVAILLVAAVSCAARPMAQTAPSTHVTVRIDMRGPIASGWFDPKSEHVGLRGAVAPLSWSDTYPAADPDGDGVYEAAIEFAIPPGPRAFVASKFKVDGAENPNDGWEKGANRPILLLQPETVVARAFDSPGDPYPRTVDGDLRVHERFSSKHVAPRDVYVLLPPGYDASSTRYPVLYMHDGENLFDASRSFAGEWEVDESIARLLAARRIAPLIVVGIANAPGDGRIDDYTPTRATVDLGGTRRETGGGAGDYGRFIVEELKPFVDRTYRTVPGVEATALGGSSLGGLATLAVGLDHPKVFGTLLAVSPSIWWDGAWIVERVRRGQRTGQRIWLDMGTEESKEAIPEARRLRDALVAKGWREGRDLRFVEVPKAAHSEVAWAARFPEMVEFAFPAR